MIDTFELSTQLSATFGQIASRFNTTIDNFVQRNKGVYELIDPLMHVGVQRVKIKQVRDKLFKQVTIVFNPSAIINENLTPLLFIPTEENVEYLKQAVDSILKEIQLSHKQWCVTRIDYAFQFKTEYHSLYPFLVSKGPCSSTTIQEFKEGSLHRRNGNSILNMYSKHIESNIKNYSLTYRKQAENLVRFERQCIRPYDLKLKSIENAKVNDWTKYFTEAAALEALETFHRYHIKDGDYYSFDSVTEYLKYKIKSKEVFQTAIETLRFIFSEGSISKAQNAITKSYETVPKRFSAQYRNLSVKQMQKSFNDFIRNHFTNNGVNPIVIPNEFRIDFLPNSVKYLTN